MGGVHDVQDPMAEGIFTVLAPQGLAVVAEAPGVLAWGPCAVAIALHCEHPKLQSLTQCIGI